MTLLTTEGFETRAAKDGWAFNVSNYVAGRYGGTSSGMSASYALPAPTDVVVTGFALFLPVASTVRTFLDIYDAGSSNPELRLQLRGDRYIDFIRGTSAVAGSTSAPVGGGGDWIWIEVKVRANDVTGFLEIKVNGTVVLSYVGDTAGQSGPGAGLGITRLEYSAANAAPIDDIYVLDTAGPGPYNDYLGEVQVETLVPNGNGASSQFVGSDGNSVDNYLLVDELPAVDTDRVESSTLGHRDLYQFTDPAAGVGEVLAVMPCVAVSKTVAGPASIKLVERLGGTDRVSAAKPVLNLGWRTSAPSVTDPNGAAWTPANVAAAQFGVEVA